MDACVRLLLFFITFFWLWRKKRKQHKVRCMGHQVRINSLQVGIQLLDLLVDNHVDVPRITQDVGLSHFWLMKMILIAYDYFYFRSYFPFFWFNVLTSIVNMDKCFAERLMELAIQVQFLNKVVNIALCTIAFEKGMNPSIHPPYKGR